MSRVLARRNASDETLAFVANAVQNAIALSATPFASVDVATPVEEAFIRAKRTYQSFIPADREAFDRRFPAFAKALSTPRLARALARMVSGGAVYSDYNSNYLSVCQRCRMARIKKGVCGLCGFAKKRKMRRVKKNPSRFYHGKGVVTNVAPHLHFKWGVWAAFDFDSESRRRWGRLGGSALLKRGAVKIGDRVAVYKRLVQGNWEFDLVPFVTHNAKISARGARELARWEREGAKTPKDQYDTVWEREEMLFRSDFVLLNRLVVKWADGQRHDYGWKVYKKFAQNVDPVVAVTNLGLGLAKRGFSRVGGAMANPRLGAMKNPLTKADKEWIYSTLKKLGVMRVKRKLGAAPPPVALPPPPPPPAPPPFARPVERVYESPYGMRRTKVVEGGPIRFKEDLPGYAEEQAKLKREEAEEAKQREKAFAEYTKKTEAERTKKEAAEKKAAGLHGDLVAIYRTLDPDHALEVAEAIKYGSGEEINPVTKYDPVTKKTAVFAPTSRIGDARRILRGLAGTDPTAMSNPNRSLRNPQGFAAAEEEFMARFERKRSLSGFMRRFVRLAWALIDKHGLRAQYRRFWGFVHNFLIFKIGRKRLEAALEGEN